MAGSKGEELAASGIEEFARSLVELVRDRAIGTGDVLLRSNATSEMAKQLRKILQDDGPEAFGRELVSVIVDDTLFHLLDAIDNGWKLGYTTSEGKSLNLCTGGMSELAGWYVSADGWRDRYSKERALSFSGSDGNS